MSYCYRQDSLNTNKLTTDISSPTDRYHIYKYRYACAIENYIQNPFEHVNPEADAEFLLTGGGIFFCFLGLMKFFMLNTSKT